MPDYYNTFEVNECINCLINWYNIEIKDYDLDHLNELNFNKYMKI